MWAIFKNLALMLPPDSRFSRDSVLEDPLFRYDSQGRGRSEPWPTRERHCFSAVLSRLSAAIGIHLKRTVWAIFKNLALMLPPDSRFSRDSVLEDPLFRYDSQGRGRSEPWPTRERHCFSAVLSRLSAAIGIHHDIVLHVVYSSSLVLSDSLL